MTGDSAQALEGILCANTWFSEVLTAVRDCAPPDWYVGGGVVRNVVWDHLHGYTRPTLLNDVDVAFYDPHDLSPERDRAVQDQLCDRLPSVPWEATNQAAVHLWYEEAFGYAVPPLRSTEEGIGTWPETVTSMGVRLLWNDQLLISAPCGLDDLFQMILRHNPRRVSIEQYRRRVEEKQIRQKWPQVRVIDG
jgi:hypothetical protein